MRMTTSAGLRQSFLVLLLLGLAGCGGSDAASTDGATDSGDVPGSAAGTEPAELPEETSTEAGAGQEGAQAATDCTTQLQQIYDEVEGLEGEDRKNALLRLAEEEQGSLMLYSASGQAVVDGLVQEFTGATGIEVDVYRAGNTDVMRRMTEERDVGGVMADVVFLNDPEITIMAREGFFAPLQTPVTDTIQPDFVHEDRAGFAILHYAVGYNTNAVRPEDAPATWADALAFDGDIFLEEKSWDWFATIMTHFMDEQGMTEDEALQLFRDAAGRAQVTSGRTATVQQLIAGGADLSPTLFINGIEDAAEEGAPVAWQPPVQPLPGRSNDVAIFEDCLRPAKSLLFVDSVLTEGQPVVGTLNYTPASIEPVETFDAPIHEYETVRMDIDMLIDERQHWEDLYMQIIAGSARVDPPPEGGG